MTTTLNGDDFEPVDPELARILPPEAAQELREWAMNGGYTFRLSRRFPHGRSGAVVCAVLEHQRYEGARKVILKLDRVRDAANLRGEHLQQQRAVHESPEFARRHLVRPVREPQRGHGELWFSFQELATGNPTEVGLGDLDVLGALFDDARTGGDADLFATTAAAIVRSVLSEWALVTHPAAMTVPQFAALHLKARLDPGGELYALRSAWTGHTMVVPDEKSPLTNPLRLVTDPAMTGGSRIGALLGKAHGDLHMDNILVRVRPTVSVDDFRLIDLMKYDSMAPLTSDPVYLVLHAVARSLGGLNDPARESLLALLLRPATGVIGAVPAWLGRLVVSVHATGEAWAGSLIDEWRAQTRLSLIAWSLTMSGRPSTRDEDRGWFLRLAARAAHLYLHADESGSEPFRAPGPPQTPRSSQQAATPNPEGVGPAVRHLVAEPAPAGPDRADAGPADWRATLCANLVALRSLATGASSAQRLAELVNAAATTGPSPRDAARAAELESLMSHLLDDHNRAMPGWAPGAPVLAEVYHCPIGRCQRTAARSRTAGVPTCTLAGKVMQVRTD
ncbi:hypothetical protein AB0B66_09195 [Catellatospora sp. NPDC049111]|uniref:hypothetical protein n=1 Tax=Catellatospora sp. NPDC049111 TaxID=3155271 RepID=UPI0033DFF4D7